MRVSFLLCLLTAFVFTAQAQTVPTPDHVVVVIYENHAFEQIIGSIDAPYINSLANDPYAALFTESYGVTHPSQPNYMYLFSGDNQNVILDFTPLSFLLPFTTPNLGAELLQNGHTFAGYSEELPYTGYTGDSVSGYRRKHSPWVNWQDGTTNGIPAALNLPLDSFPTDYNNLPNVSFIIPTLDNDMHDGSIAVGDAWLQTHLDSYAQWCKTHNSLLIFTYDEDDDLHNNRITTIFLGQMVKHGQYNETITHNNVLHVIEDMYSLPHAGNSNGAATINDCWLYNPVAGIQSNVTTICQGQSVQFTDNSTQQPDSWTWLFPGGNPVVSHSQNPVVTYNSAGTYSVSLMAYNHVGSGFMGLSNLINVTPGPAINLSASAQTVCYGDTVHLSVSGANTYQWQANNNSLPGSGNSIAIVPQSSTTYRVVGSDGTCISDTASVTVQVNGPYNTQLNTAICNGETYPFKGQNLSATGIYRDTLSSAFGCDSFVTLSLVVNQNTVSLVHGSTCPGVPYFFHGQNLTVAGTYYDTLTAQTGCDSFLILMLAANAGPTVSWAGADSLYTTGAPISLTGGTPAGGVYTGTGVNNNTFYADSVVQGSYTISYTYTDSLGCTASATKIIVVLPNGITEASADGIKLYPDPAQDVLYLQLIAEEDGAITVTDLTGRIVPVEVSGTKNNYVIQLKQLPAATYLLQYQSKTTGFTRRFIKE
ncbi:MAG: alkaline phosphatase family protein [Chitinophagales bacterium]